MPDASTTTVDGVEPSILVKYTSNASSHENVKSIILNKDDGGAQREIKLGYTQWVTPAELALVTGGPNIEIVENKNSSSSPSSTGTIESVTLPVGDSKPETPRGEVPSPRIPQNNPSSPTIPPGSGS